MKNIIKEYFTYTLSEKRGLVVLCVLVLVVFSIPYFYNESKNDVKLFDLEKQEELNRVLSQLCEKKVAKKKIHLFDFDPNSATEEQLLLLGLDKFQVQNILKYRQKGGVFYNAEDLKRIYGIEESYYKFLEPFVQIKLKHPKAKVQHPKKSVLKKPQLFMFDPNTIGLSEWEKLGVEKKIAQRILNYLEAGARFKYSEDLKKIYGLSEMKYQELKSYISIAKCENSDSLKVDLNKAGEEELSLLQGVGEILSARIVKYRVRLGGFVSKIQLKEVYGISRELYLKIEKSVRLDTCEVVCLGLNSSKLKILKEHPYLSYRQAKDIVRYREKNRPYKKIEDLRLYKIVPDTTYLKLKPYLSID